MVNTDKLRAAIGGSGITMEELAARVGVDTATLYRKMKAGDKFTVGQVAAIGKALALDAQAVNDIFFDHELA